MYYSFFGMLRLHGLMGAGFAIAYIVYCSYRSKPRKLFTFGGEFYTLGNRLAWMKWYVICYVFELVTSFYTQTLYEEIAGSLFEAAMMVLGMFVVDRVALLFEIDTTTPTPVPGWNWRAPFERAGVGHWWPRKERHDDSEARAAENIRKFNETLGR